MKIVFQSYTKKDDFVFSPFPSICFISYKYDDCDIQSKFIVEFNWLCWSLFIIKTY